MNQDETESSALVTHDSQEEAKWVEFKSPVLSRELIGKSAPKDLAKMWAAFILKSGEESYEFLAYFRCIRDVLSQNHINGPLLINRSSVTADTVAELVVSDLKNNQDLKLTLGREGWARQFIFDVYAACHGEHNGTGS